MRSRSASFCKRGQSNDAPSREVSRDSTWAAQRRYIGDGGIREGPHVTLESCARQRVQSLSHIWHAANGVQIPPSHDLSDALQSLVELQRRFIEISHSACDLSHSIRHSWPHSATHSSWVEAFAQLYLARRFTSRFPNTPCVVPF